MEADTHSAIFNKSGNGRHVYVCVWPHPSNSKTLQMHGFPIQTYGGHFKVP